ncbi:MAG: glycosyltransferase family 2 protein, partial [Hyphomicrobiales bacterium]|nr:glycosyltransferase family 2 protein [Hyphomicrobiales bacterium]
MKSIGLCMIVKNESHVIARCLDSVRPLVDYVLIEDTGSSDGTQELVRNWLREHDVAGEVIEEPWLDFGYNRSHALAALRQVEAIDYALIIDADSALVVDQGFDAAKFKSELSEDFYDFEIRNGAARFLRTQLCSNRLPFCFKGVLHEYLKAPPDNPRRGLAQGLYVEDGRDGARNKNPHKYQDDAALLERALLTETDPLLVSRYTFYLAQSYRDCGE